MQKLRPRYVVLGGFVVLGCGIALGELSGQGPLHDRAPPPCVLNGPCLPNRATWGYYEPKWRRWPGTAALAGPTTGAETELDPYTIPRPEVEDVRVPSPITPPPLGAAGGTDPGAAPPPAEGGQPGAVPFVPTPAVPPGDGLDAPLPAAPLPTTPLPGAVVPEEDGLAPDAGLPTAPNPFDGSSNPNGRPRLDSDPPPSLPPSLRSSRRARDAKRAADLNSSRPNLAGSLTRLPKPPQSATQGRYDVRQASATVWASGAEDIRSTDPNAGRVEQAIHHEPVE